MRKCVHDGSRALTLSAARQELARWLAGVREASRVLFPEEAAGRKACMSSGEGRSATRIPDDR